jgi:uncharacterized ferredoxin-like protein
MDGIDIVAQMMAIAAVTAPKTKGQNFVEVKVLTGESVRELGEAMVAYGARTGRKNFDRDGMNVMHSEAVVLIGLKDTDTCGLDCGACGQPNCASFLKLPKYVEGEFQGPICAYRLIDMGIALGSAVKVASMLNVDNRIMYRIGTAAKDAKLAEWEFVLGIPLSVSGKSIYFDR